MRGLLLLLLVGCSTTDVDSESGVAAEEPVFEIGEPEEAAELVPTPGDCDHDVSLYGMSGSGPTSIGPLTVDGSGTDICLTLDARDNIWVGHFAAGTEYENGDASSFQLTLFDRDGVVLRAGWDVSVDVAMPRTFANLEYGVDKGQVLQALLHVRARTGTATSAIRLYLFEPYE